MCVCDALCPLAAEHLLQQSVHALKMELEQRGAGGGGGGGEELHLALSCHLSASCPTLNQDPDSSRLCPSACEDCFTVYMYFAEVLKFQILAGNHGL